jgi:hypothetical protein
VSPRFRLILGEAISPKCPRRGRGRAPLRASTLRLHWHQLSLTLPRPLRLRRAGAPPSRGDVGSPGLTKWQVVWSRSSVRHGHMIGVTPALMQMEMVEEQCGHRDGRDL